MQRERKDGTEYFDSLPAIIKAEAIKQGIPMNSRIELQNFYSSILHDGPETVKPDR